jgi:hypothetical protein
MLFGVRDSVNRKGRAYHICTSLERERERDTERERETERDLRRSSL